MFLDQEPHHIREEEEVVKTFVSVWGNQEKNEADGFDFLSCR